MLFKTLDTAIGVIFLFLLLSVVASVLVELMANWNNWRAKMLYDSIDNMLDGSPVDARRFFENPMVLSLAREDGGPLSWFDLLERVGWRFTMSGPKQTKVSLPSYIPATTFSAVVVDELNRQGNGTPATGDAVVPRLQEVINNARAVQRMNSGKPDGLSSVIVTSINATGATLQSVRAGLEKWFNDAMDRTTGWYKRRTQVCLFLVGLVISLGANVDTIGVTLWLWKGDAARDAIVKAASSNANIGKPSAKCTTASPAAPLANDPVKEATVAACNIMAVDGQILALQYPIGWNRPLGDPRDHPAEWLQYLIGALISAIAISMGSAFWFNALQDALKIRGAGPKPQT